MVGFVGSDVLGWRRVLAGGRSGRCMRTSGRVMMSRGLQRPDAEGPPPLEDFFDKSKRKPPTTGQEKSSVKIGTGRGTLKEADGDLGGAFDIAMKRASETLGREPQLVHLTWTTDIDPDALRELVKKTFSQGVPYFGRSIAKDGAEGVVEILMLAAENGRAKIASAAIPTTDDAAGTDAAASAAADLAKQLDMDECQFILFGHGPGPTADAVRTGLGKVFPNAVAYGGVAAGLAEDANKWALMMEDGVENRTSGSDSHVIVAAMPGDLSFMLSAVIKSWAQPKFQAPLAFLSPKYVGDDVLDLLTAIRFDDWDKFTYILEEAGVDVNVRWTHKQNQAPLLAAAGRGRLEMVKYLLDKGADVQARNDGGFTAIMYTDMLKGAGGGCDPKVIEQQREVLLAAGAIPEEPVVRKQ
mmetsp:Transcript_4418/g.13404  ORF Transcript_4418/g.13404 Transcript_4418/m.13404 type:complete len:412 (+) Transcript_4418:95-1330(+)